MASAGFQGETERRRATASKPVVGLALLGAAGVAFVTLCPIEWRPHLASANLERFAAYGVLGALISRASGRRGLAATVVAVGLAFGLEAGQRLAPGRHAEMADALVKALGGVLGVAGVQLMYPLRRIMVRLAGPPAGFAERGGDRGSVYRTTKNTKGTKAPAAA
jgi:hypothetical protein